MVTYKVIKEIAEISNTTTTAKRLTLISWNNCPAKLDLRIWKFEDGESRPSKGVTLNEEEAQSLTNALTAYFADIVKGASE